jgi:hypothetical protein
VKLGTVLASWLGTILARPPRDVQTTVALATENIFTTRLTPAETTAIPITVDALRESGHPGAVH